MNKSCNRYGIIRCFMEKYDSNAQSSIRSLATFNYRVRGTCVPTRAFHARLARKAGVMLKANLIVLTARWGFSQSIHFNIYKRKQSQSTFLRKKSTCQWRIFKNYKETLNVPRVHTAVLIKS